MDPDLFKNMSAWDKLKTITSGAWAGSKLLANNFSGYLEHSEYPDYLRRRFKDGNPELGTERVDRGPLDRALNYGGAYQFGQTSGLDYEDSDKLAKAYQLRGYLIDKYINRASPERLQDASMDYYENREGLRKAYADKAAGKNDENIRELSASYAKDFTGQYNTKLSPKEEQEFQAWAKKNNKLRDLYDYDMRGAWKAGVAGKGGEHSPDTYKKPNHPTFSDESIYHGKDKFLGGHWGREGNKDTYTPGKTNLYGYEDLRDYFKKNEPDVILK